MPQSVERSLIFRLNDNGQGPEIVQQVFLENGWQEYDEEVHQEHEWNLWWRTSRFRNSDYDQLQPWQWLNHYPRSTAITKKDCLARNMKRMKGVYGPLAYNFSPIAFNLPNDYTRFVAEYSKQHEKKNDICWICKPADLSRGRGIFIFRELSELQYDCNAVVQQYISNPLLISGYKFDLRLYVMVPSFHPLQIYVYEEGLVRFGTEKYDLNTLGNHYAHLTNTSINKHSPNYMMDKERVGAGCKWTLRQLRHYFHQVSINDNQLWGRIVNIIILTLIIQGAQVPKVEHCFELYGFDVMIDDDLKPWLLEVNFSPALSSDCQADIIVKKGMLNDLLQMIGFSEEDKLHGGETQPPGRSRKSSFSYGQHRDGSHLPKISSSHSLTPGSCSVGEADDDNDGEPLIIPIIPGCGLPSVQQTVLQQRLPAPRGPSPVSEGESRITIKPVAHVGKADVKKSSKLHAASAEHGSKVSPVRHTGSPSTKPSGGGQTHATSRQALIKKDSKVSAQSDSGFSSYSGSSDNSDVVSQNEDGSKSVKDKGGTEAVPHKTRNRTGSIRGQNDAESDEQATASIQSTNHVIKRPSKRPPVSSLSFASKGRGSVQPTRQRSHFVPFISMPAVHRSGSLQPVPKFGYGLMRGQAVGRSQLAANRSASCDAEKLNPTAVPRVGSRTPPGRVGDFVRVFPFNEATNKCSLGNMDIKTVVRECHKLLRERLRVIKEQAQADGRSSNDHDDTIQIFDVPLLWKPLTGDSLLH